MHVPGRSVQVDNHLSIVPRLLSTGLVGSRSSSDVHQNVPLVPLSDLFVVVAEHNVLDGWTVTPIA